MGDYRPIRGLIMSRCERSGSLILAHQGCQPATSGRKFSRTGRMENGNLESVSKQKNGNLDCFSCRLVLNKRRRQ